MANLIAYYSRKGENYWADSIKNLAKGNTERVAEFVQYAVGDLFEIETVEQYAADYYECIEEAKAELRAGARPEIALSLVDAGLNMADYDTIFLGYPNWWGICPMCVFTFLEHYDLSGKRIVPSCTNEGSGMGGSEKCLERICAGVTVELGLSITGNQATRSQGKVAAWAKKFV
ncbi:MAG: flavodoxin [Olsenella sp.]|jgi:flavodoxin|nr:flavodoxin [Olsenella sp.]MCI1810615.1 flavodoxin [Olsenella sp.]MCI1879302.1 flavodoxin [Olsenella sp.]